MVKFGLNYFIRVLYRILKILSRSIFWLIIGLGLIGFFINLAVGYYLFSTNINPANANIIRTAAENGKIAYRLTEPNEIEVLLGTPTRKTTINSDGIQKLTLNWPGVDAVFTKMRYFDAQYMLQNIKLGGNHLSVDSFDDILGGIPVNIGEGKRLVLRNISDLYKFDKWGGFWNVPKGVSLVNLDLRQYGQLLETIPFDNRTEWPEPSKMPSGFDPEKLLEEGKNPGLGIRELHKNGIDGRGVSIAIIDQVLLQNHQEYTNQLIKYEEVGLITKYAPPQMHGAPVASIAVGKSCGVAPKAKLYYFALSRTSMPDNQSYCEIIDKIIQMNKNLDISEQIHVISISTGMFSKQANFKSWEKSLAKAKQHKILIVTCDPAFLKYGTLSRIPCGNLDDPLSYKCGRYKHQGDVLRVPTGNRTTASHYGPEVYTYWTDGGMSWAAPYLAGLAALAYQINPEIEPQTIIDLWIQSAIRTDAGQIINPRGFIEAVKQLTHLSQ